MRVVRIGLFLVFALFASNLALARSARIAVLAFRPLSDAAWIANLTTFKDALRQHGWVEGDNLNLTMQSTEGKDARAGELAAALLAQSPDVIVTFNYPITKAVAEKTGTIPIVMFAVPNPVGLGLVASLAHPGANVTGISSQTEDTLAKDLQLLKETVPAISRLAVVTYGVEPYWALTKKAYAAAAKSVGVVLDIIPVNSHDELDAALAQAAAATPDAMLVSSIPLFATRGTRIASFAIEHRLPTFTFQTRMVRDGLLMSYEADVPEMYRTEAAIIDKVLRGAKPADLPVEQPTQFRLVVNVKTARAIGIEVPPSVLARADEVVE